MSTRANNDDLTDSSEPRGERDGTRTIESYETEDGVVFYDAENPLAWVETSQTLVLDDLA